MTFSGSVSWSFVAVCLAALVLATLIRQWNKARHLPPGPSQFPGLGIVRPPHDYLEAFKEWADTYGDVMVVKIFGMPIVVLNSRRAVSELLEKRAGLTSGRPKQIMSHDMVGLEPDPGQTSDSKMHKEYRRMFATALSPRAVQAYGALQAQQFRQLALDLLTAPQDYMNAMKRAVSAVAYRVAYGYEMKGPDDPMFDAAEQAFRILEFVLGPPSVIVDAFPFLKYVPDWLPGGLWNRRAKEYKEFFTEARETPFSWVEHDIATGTEKPSFTAALLEENTYDKERIKWAAAAIHLAGSDTSTAAVHTFLATMVLHPEVQLKAQEELDRVIGREKPPTVADRERLPYCWAVVQEALRWHPVSPFALLHQMGKEETYEGYVIPEGSKLMINVWALSRDERDFPDASTFRPERYLPGSSYADPEAVRATMGFGYGHRRCPGQHLAEANIFTAAVTLLWALRLELKPGARIDWSKHIGVHRPKDFPIRAEPRFPGVAEILQGALAE